MSKQKRKHTPKLAKNSGGAGSKRTATDGVVTGPNYPTEEIKWWREAIEGLLVAIVLALLIRGFEAEAFVIPTGSMAPTLRGRHKDVSCERCTFEYAAGASLDHEQAHGRVELTICPMCGFPQRNNYTKSRDASFTGDRILVSKFAYDPLGVPERFDVIVFKNPNDAKQNYIKRLCGLPGEEIEIFQGDLYVTKLDDPNNQFIARKPPKKMLAMLQPVHDTNHIPTILDSQGLPPRWQPVTNSSSWSTPDKNRTFQVSKSPQLEWIRYRHIVADMEDWLKIQSNIQPAFAGRRGELISDFYGYNAYLNANARFPPGEIPDSLNEGINTFNFPNRATGKNWVGDLAVECDVEIASDDGEFVLDLVEGGWHFQCTIDVATGLTKLSISDPEGQVREFDASPDVSATTAVHGRGNYRVMFSNVDSELRLWVDGDLVQFDSVTTYRRGTEGTALRPFYGGPDNPGDLAPVGVGGRNLEANVQRIKIHRDKYYIAVRSGRMNSDPTSGDYKYGVGAQRVREVFRSPEVWSSIDLFNHMRKQSFRLEDFDDDSKDQFFPMGDNSPQSHDARVWNMTSNYVERQFLIGEAILIYYPHPWHVKLPGENYRSLPIIIYPKFSRMGLIR